MIRGYNQSSIDQSIERLWPYLRPQRVFTGSGAIENLKLASATSKPFIVTDIGLKRAGLAINLQKSHFPDGKIEIHDAPTPTGVSLFKLYESFKKSDHDSIMGAFPVYRFVNWPIMMKNEDKPTFNFPFWLPANF